MNENQIQQGDVTLERIDKLPKDCKPRKRIGGRSVVTEGSQTGNSHYFDHAQVTIHDATDGTAFVTNDAKRRVPMKHTRDHDPVFLAPTSIYRIGGINELDPLSGMERKVVD